VELDVVVCCLVDLPAGEEWSFSREHIHDIPALIAFLDGRRETAPSSSLATTSSDWWQMVKINLHTAMPTRRPFCSSTVCSRRSVPSGSAVLRCFAVEKTMDPSVLSF
jgi:hypothetical protein